jgi:HAD superfamily hydrolase (TIGR01549 family)
MYKVILFDLDGTLLHMDQDEFTRTYIALLMKRMLSLGGDKNLLGKGFNDGLRAMLINDGTRSNAQAYWDGFGKALGSDASVYINNTNEFYSEEYLSLKEITRENPYADALISGLKERGCKLVLATNPVFPLIAQVNRLSWSGTTHEKFDYITDYETSRYCKPRPEYYLDICERMGVKPCECLMVGNDTSDDMLGASAAGLNCFLVTDCLIETPDTAWQGERGTFAQLTAKLLG